MRGAGLEAQGSGPGRWPHGGSGSGGWVEDPGRREAEAPIVLLAAFCVLVPSRGGGAPVNPRTPAP